MQHSDLTARCGCRLGRRSRFGGGGSFVRAIGKTSDRGLPFADECRNSVPHSFIATLETENVDVPLGRAFDIAHAQRDVIDSFELHTEDRMHKIYRIRTD